MIYATEIDLNYDVTMRLEGLGNDVYPEVKPAGFETSADLVAVAPGGDIAVIEGKLRYSGDVIEQALAWRPYAHRCWVAVPMDPERGPRDEPRAWGALHRSARACGVGVLFVYPSSTLYPRIKAECTLEPKSHVFTDILCDEMKRYGKSGQSSGRWWSTARDQRYKVIWEYVAEEPGALAREMWRELHGRTRFLGASKGKWIGQIIARGEAGKIPFVRTEVVAGLTRFLPMGGAINNGGTE